MPNKKSSKKKTKKLKKFDPMDFNIRSISVEGYKSICSRQQIHIAPITILAGANSSGKSSFIQPLLLLKQTSETPYDSGTLALNGLVNINNFDSLLCKINKTTDYKVTLEISPTSSNNPVFIENRYFKNNGIALETKYVSKKGEYVLKESLNEQEISHIIESINIFDVDNNDVKYTPKVTCKKGFFTLQASFGTKIEKGEIFNTPFLNIDIFPMHVLGIILDKFIIIPALRGYQKRGFDITHTGEFFSGKFQDYVPSIIAHWNKCDQQKKENLVRDLVALGMTSDINAININDSQLEIKVARLPKSKNKKAEDMVNIADVGIGVSQVLPVLVGLIEAVPGQMVYIEHPELNLHPSAIVKLATVIAKAAKRGVKIIVETHSSLLILAIQTIVAEQKVKLNHEDVKLHWFKRNSKGATIVTSTELDQNGAFGDWPSDLDLVALKLGDRYLDAGGGF